MLIVKPGEAGCGSCLSTFFCEKRGYCPRFFLFPVENSQKLGTLEKAPSAASKLKVRVNPEGHYLISRIDRALVLIEVKDSRIERSVLHPTVLDLSP
jgi:hypothetical protein